MKLKTWVEEEKGRSARLADFLTSVVRMIEPTKEISRAQVTAWTSDEAKESWRPIPAYLAPKIEEFTDGHVMRWDCCPKEWHLLWPELKRYAGAPAIVEPGKALTTET